MTEDALARERAHQDTWYARAIRERFFEREGFRRLTAWNLNLLRRSVSLDASSRVLSLGCGTGEYELLLARSVGHLTAIDLSPVAIAEARRRAQAQALGNLEFIEGSLVEMTFANGSFDVVYAFGVLHHLPVVQRQGLLTRIRGWLGPGGVFYARDPNARGALRWAEGWFRQAAFHSPNEAALDPIELCREITAAGFADAGVGYTDVLAGPLPWLMRSPSSLLWSAVFGFDRLWLSAPGLRRLASQFEIKASRDAND